MAHDRIGNRKAHVACRIVPFLMTLNDLNFKVISPIAKCLNAISRTIVQQLPLLQTGTTISQTLVIMDHTAQNHLH